MPANKWFFNAGLADFQPVFDAYGVSPEGGYDSNKGGKLTAGDTDPKLKEPLEKLK